MVKANSNIESKEYREALSLATQSKEMANKCFEDGIQSIIDSVEKLEEIATSAGSGSDQGKQRATFASTMGFLRNQ